MNVQVMTAESIAAPVVESLSVRVVVDSRYELFMPKAEHPAVRIEHVMFIPGRQMSTLAGEYGLSLHLESVSSGSNSEYLLDFGYTPEILNRNFDLLDIDPKRIKGLILSHGHRDHYGGLPGFVERHRSHMPDDLDLMVGHESAFAEKWLKAGPDGSLVSWGKLDRTHLTAHNVAPVCCAAPLALDGAFTTGYIERNSFEQITGGTMVSESGHFTEEERRGKLVQDLPPRSTQPVTSSRGAAWS